MPRPSTSTRHRRRDQVLADGTWYDDSPTEHKPTIGTLPKDPVLPTQPPLRRDRIEMRNEWAAET
ncbi:hypothetical protein MOQ72_26615 [Saccharopolyspora sp. K220]|uniref:hypothetical protein n=1 Tax=Saccharopolyspora soli TaxID=2926618 RepID=UPI001F5A07FD|nr:hypothetical protein [Saccharopolyspora soli]MCI2421022.1 hypothetical protein [Saccharopolyspora soli]